MGALRIKHEHSTLDNTGYSLQDKSFEFDVLSPIRVLNPKSTPNVGSNGSGKVAAARLVPLVGVEARGSVAPYGDGSPGWVAVTTYDSVMFEVPV